MTGPGGGTSEHSSTVGATHGRNKYSFDLLLAVLYIYQVILTLFGYHPLNQSFSTSSVSKS